MSLWGEHLIERMGKEVMEDERYFVAYHFLDSGVVIDELHIAKEFRKQGLGSKVCDEIAALAKARGLSQMACTVISSTLNATDSMAAAIAYGFKICGSDDRKIWMKKEI